MAKKNIFAKFQDYVNKPKRNVFDLSFANNLTTKFGQLTPVFCKECIPGDSFKIHSKFALQFMPMKFPVQTPMKAYLHYFYVRNRTLWKDWMDFIGKTKDNLTLPYVTPTDKEKFYRVGGLADYLGVPNVMYGTYGNQITGTIPDYSTVSNTTGVNPTGFSDKTLKWTYLTMGKYLLPSYARFLSFYEMLAVYAEEATDVPGDFLVDYCNEVESNLIGQTLEDCLTDNIDVNSVSNYFSFVEAGQSGISNSHPNSFRISPITLLSSIDLPADLRGTAFDLKLKFSNYFSSRLFPHNDFVFICYIDTFGKVIGFKPYQSQITSEKEITFDINIDLLNVKKIAIFTHSMVKVANSANNVITYIVNNLDNGTSYLYDDLELTLTYDSSSIQTIGKDALVNTPYDNQIHLNALPFRAYEAIYNAYYRNPQNNPYILNGTAEYNKYIPSYDGGADVNEYDLHQRNWEYDFLTSAVQTPQQGDVAPLVGISVTGEATFQDDNGNTYYASAQYDENGQITGWTSHSPEMPQGSLRLLMDMAGTGISINDLRNVNAFQKFLENNIRRGLKYRDQIKSHFGVDVRYDELDMPEFIGGCSTVVNINKLSQTSESGDTPLGSFVGQGSAYGESKHDITHYCDEHGFIIGILSVVPVPVYSQLLPKFFTKTEQLDYYFPEFGHIGYQPILQKEVSPLQTYYAGDDLNAVFGYNRAWYDYLASTDEVHAQFRTTMRDFIMNRTFDVAPQLGEDFLLVDPDQVNDVFLAGNDDDNIYAPESDKIIGSMYFEVSKKSPIPLFGIPKLD